MRSTSVLKVSASLAALSFATVMAGSALAQSAPTQTMPPEEAVMPGDMGAEEMGTDVTAPSTNSTDAVAADAAQPAGMPTSSPTPVEQAYMLKAGDPTVTSNPPVPDTPATRRAFGGPDSNGGKQTRAVGN